MLNLTPLRSDPHRQTANQAAQSCLSQGHLAAGKRWEKVGENPFPPVLEKISCSQTQPSRMILPCHTWSKLPGRVLALQPLLERRYGFLFLGNKSEGGLIGLMRQNRPSKKRNVLFQTIGWRDSYILYKYVIYAININFLIYVPALSPMTLDWLPPVSTCDIPQEKRSQRSPPRVFSKTTVDFQSVDFIR